MIQCHINKKKSIVWTKAKGDGYDISLEVLALIEQIHGEIAKVSPEAGDAFKRTIIAGVLDPKSPVWED